MRHIPEAELHAYLDQALSRSQCVEIERHLAGCTTCQSHRDAIAGLRDQTTALLARLGPPLVLPPPYATLEARFAERQQSRRRWIANGAWAASLVGAALLGWGLNPAPAPFVAAGNAGSPTPNVAASSAPRADSGTHDIAARVTLPVRARTEAPPRHEPRLMRVRQTETEPAATWGFARAVETDPSAVYGASAPDQATSATVAADAPDFSTQPVSTPPELAGLWRTVVPDSVIRARGADVPRVPGLAVVQMRVQPGEGAEDGDVTAVDQVLATGELIRTIAGPAGRVGSLVDERSQGDSVVPPGGSRVTVTFRQGDRMVAVTGPSDALGSLLSRVNTPRRRY